MLNPNNLLLFITNVGKLQSISNNLAKLKNVVDGRIRQLTANNGSIKTSNNLSDNKDLTCHILDDIPPWTGIEHDNSDIPGMITQEECQYYKYIGQFYSGAGEVLELGPWLGRSTFYILQGLVINPNFTNKKLHVVDDFVWRASWMNDRVPKEDQLHNHQDFQFLFEKYAEPFWDMLQVQKRRITTYDGNESIPYLQWGGKPIELLYVDCGRTIEVNDSWYRHLEKSFISGKTLIMMQDWSLHKEVPVQWYNQTKLFTDSKGSKLHLIHELRDGGLATFLYTGI